MSLPRLVDWVDGEVLPFWLEQGLNPATGLFHECLHLDGRPDGAAALRIRTQFRQIYVLAHAAILGRLPRDAALERAASAARRLRRQAFDPDRRAWIHRLDAAGNVDDSLLDLYDQAFVLNGLLWLARATGEPDFRRWAAELLDTLTRRFAAAPGGYAEDDRGTLPRRQNPHMHLFEAAMAGIELGFADLTAPLAAEMHQLFLARFFDDARGRLTEFFGPDWRRDPAFGSDRYEPGHAAEWVWLLRRYARLADRPAGPAEGLLTAGVRRTLQRQPAGLLPDVVDAADRPLSSGARLWPQLEYLKALVVTGGTARDAADAFAARVMAAYVADMPRGCWCDRVDLAGRRIADRVPASIVYHLFSVVVEAG